MGLVWNDVFAGNTDQTLDHYFDQLGQQFYGLYKYLSYQPAPVQFKLTPEQQQTFNEYFSQAQNQYLCLYGTDYYLATIRRLGLITYRIAMILRTIWTMEEHNFTNSLTCSNTDFNTVLSVVIILMQHAAQVYN